MEERFLLKLQASLFHGNFSHFLNCANGTKLSKTSHISKIDSTLVIFDLQKGYDSPKTRTYLSLNLSFSILPFDPP